MFGVGGPVWLSGFVVDMHAGKFQRPTAISTRRGCRLYVGLNLFGAGFRV